MAKEQKSFSFEKIAVFCFECDLLFPKLRKDKLILSCQQCQSRTFGICGGCGDCAPSDDRLCSRCHYQCYPQEYLPLQTVTKIIKGETKDGVSLTPDPDPEVEVLDYTTIALDLDKEFQAKLEFLESSRLETHEELPDADDYIYWQQHPFAA
jgi:hypothetical protein